MIDKQCLHRHASFYLSFLRTLTNTPLPLPCPIPSQAELPAPLALCSEGIPSSQPNKGTL